MVNESNKSKTYTNACTHTDMNSEMTHPLVKLQLPAFIPLSSFPQPFQNYTFNWKRTEVGSRALAGAAPVYRCTCTDVDFC